MKLFQLVMLVAGLSMPLVHAVELKIDDAHSEVGFEVKHLVKATVHGNFKQFSGSIDLDDKDITKSKVKFIVKTDSINTGVDKRDGHLRSAEFFDVQKYPEAKFVSSSIKSIGDGKYELKGDLTIHGVTKKVTFVMDSLGTEKDPNGNVKRMYQAAIDINRKDYGLVWNKLLDNGGVLVGENVKLTINLELAEALKPSTAKSN